LNTDVPTVPPTVRKATAADVPQLAAMLARAFDDDPVAMYLFPDGRRRRAGLRRFFSIQLRSTFLRDDECYTTGEVGGDISGGALWSSPGRPKAGTRELLRLLPILPLLGRRLPTALQFLGAIEAKHPKDRPHFYLGVLGTDPPWQGKGIGSALLMPVLERCDAEGIPAYLESSKERNVPFYGRHGWEVTEELDPPGGGPRLWLMWREPR
jgi:GNAT superfamily N-acetyltransferase